MEDLETNLAESLSSYKKNLTAHNKLIIKNRLGLHARAAGKLVEAAQLFKSKITLTKDDFEADVRSILSLISLGCPYNTEVELTATGEDASEAIKAISAVIMNRFGEI
jgi:phosphocarrier protein